MVITEKKQDLFTVPQSYTLVHCVSSDFALGAGIAKQFTARGVKAELLQNYPQHWDGHGYACYTSATQWNGEINLVTKERYWLKPTIETLRESLIYARDHYIAEKNIELMAMPKIGCGLDRLTWPVVKAELEAVFGELPGEIVVCSI